LDVVVGAGKTFLTSMVINNLHSSIQRDEALAYFYFEKDRELNYDASLRCLVKQLAVPAEENKIHSAIFAKYNERQNQGNSKDLLTSDEILKLLPELIAPRSKVYIVLDALDECKSLTDLLDAICAVMDSVHNVWVFASGRPDIKDDLPPDRLEVRIEASRNDADIRRFLMSKINSARESTRPTKANCLLRDDDLSRMVYESIANKSGGM
jgi:Cdc6-like AAA superfamily ATPase